MSIKEDIFNILCFYGIKLTSNRIREIYEHIHKKTLSIQEINVYLQRLVSEGLVYKSDLDGKSKLYEALTLQYIALKELVEEDGEDG